ncbi:MAG: DUF4097 family beta strand repeat-containing protein [Rhodothermales bacterium]|nr:DUF4097 family beta strand repeat-containing protein [Rhodothermales bacterium]
MSALITGLFLVAGCTAPEPPAVEMQDGRLVLAGASLEEHIERSLAFEGRTFVWKNPEGDVTLEGIDAPIATLRFTKRARGNDRVAAQEHLDGIELRESGSESAFSFTAHYPRKSTHSAVALAGQLPRATNLSLEINNGNIALTDVAGDLTAKSVNGSITVRHQNGTLKLATENGDIFLVENTVHLSHRIEMTTLNGDIELFLPENIDATVDASTSVGTIELSGLALSTKAFEQTSVGAALEATLGKGGPTILLSTQKGRINIGTIPVSIPEKRPETTGVDSVEVQQTVPDYPMPDTTTTPARQPVL